MTEDEEQLFNIFFPFYIENKKRVQRDNIRFAHYTSSSAAMSVIKNKEFWMRGSSSMNDYSEVQHGLRCIQQAWGREQAPPTKIQEELEICKPNITSEIARRFNHWMKSFEFETYISSFSEHDNSIEDEFGRLSMWRAYGGENPAVLVMNSSVFFNESDALNGVYTSPVAYKSPDEVHEYFDAVASVIELNRDFIATQDVEEIINSVFHLLRFTMLCTKHPGFSEEKEWRVFYTPLFEMCPRLTEIIEDINGVPQKIYKIPLEDVPEQDLVGIKVTSLIEKIIIGPSNNSFDILKAFSKQFSEEGFSNPYDRVRVSDIPLKT
ncbi:MAG: DUF2971 domain-containing protein [Bdellovibrionales bacterium]